MSTTVDLVIRNIGQLLTMSPASGGRGDAGADPVAGLGLVLDAAVAVQGDLIHWAGKDQDLAKAVPVTDQTKIVDAGGCVVMPGLVDCHTHTVFAGSRAQEFARRISGASYEEILAKGGGILSTVQATREASCDSLVATALQRLHAFLSFGVTTVEVKSGYGLDTDSELKMLRAIREADKRHSVDLVPTFLGAHTVPLNLRAKRERYLQLLIEEMLPAVAEENLARFCDVFCEEGAFSLAETRRVLEAGLELGLRPKLHAEQLTRSGSIDLAIELGACSVDHLEQINEADATKLADAKTTAVMLPGATYFLGKSQYAPGRMLADAGCSLAVSTDFNPGSCMSQNLPLMLNMACIYNGIFPREALLGATRWAAEALDLDGAIGSLLPGKQADILVLNTPDYRNLIYQFGANHTQMVFKKGKAVWPRPSLDRR